MRASTPFAIREKMFVEIPKGSSCQLLSIFVMESRHRHNYEVQLNLLIPRLKIEPLKKFLAQG